VPGGGGGGIAGRWEESKKERGKGWEDKILLLMAAKSLQGKIITLPIKMEWRENHRRR
jgi:hypothetical protein